MGHHGMVLLPAMRPDLFGSSLVVHLHRTARMDSHRAVCRVYLCRLLRLDPEGSVRVGRVGWTSTGMTCCYGSALSSSWTRRCIGSTSGWNVGRRRSTDDNT